MTRVATREATCSCGQLRLEAAGDPFVVSMCHCLACQRRTGSAFGLQAGFTSEQVHVAGRFSDYVRVSDEADEKEHVFHFCPDCGATVFYTGPAEPDVVVVSVGAFADPSFPPPSESSYGVRRHPWVALPAGIRHDEVWAPLQPLYDAGRYAEVADRARELIAAHPGNPQLLYNVACCESLAARTTDAIEHLRLAIELAPGELRPLAAGDSDLDPIRDEPAFRELLG
jgi:hypothetical protein